MDHGKHVDARSVCRAQDLDDASLGIHLAVLPAVHLSHDLVPDLCALCGGNIEIARETRVICHDVVEVLGLLKRSYNRCARSLEDAQNSSLGAAVPTRAPVITGLLDQPSDHAVAVECGVQVVGCDEEIFAPLLLGEDVAGAPCVELELAGEKVGRFRQDEMIDPHADDAPRTLQGSQCLVEEVEVFLMHPHGLDDGRGLQGSLFQHAQNRIG